MTFRFESSGVKQGKGQGKYYIKMEQYIWRPRSQIEHRDFSYVKSFSLEAKFYCLYMHNLMVSRYT